MRDYESVSAAARQAGQVVRSKKATGEQKREALKVLGSAVAGESVKKVAEHTAHEARKVLRTPAGKELVKKGARVLATGAKATGVGALAVGTIALAAHGIDKTKRANARAAAKRELAATKKRLAPQKLTAAQEAQLLKQYEEFYYKQPVQNPFVGK